MRVIYGLLYVLILSISVSCTKHKAETPPDLGYDYAPIKIGKYVVYDVDSTVYDDFFGDTIITKYRIKEKFEENITDNEGRSAIRLVRYIKMFDATKDYSNIPWVIKDVWNYTKTNTTLEVVEEDIRFTKLTFPVKEDATWNGNAFNTMGEWEYSYTYIDKRETLNGNVFENVLCVKQKDDKLINYIHRQYYIEKYAKGVGLIYKEIKDLEANKVLLNQDGSVMPVENRIKKGVIYKLTYVTHGFE